MNPMQDSFRPYTLTHKIHSAMYRKTKLVLLDSHSIAQWAKKKDWYLLIRVYLVTQVYIISDHVMRNDKINCGALWLALPTFQKCTLVLVTILSFSPIAELNVWHVRLGPSILTQSS